MSLINKMLRDLDRRDAAAGGIEATAPGALAEHVRPVTGWGMASDYFWRAAVVLMLIALGWIAWTVWQSMHRPASADLQDRPPRVQMSGPKAEAPPPAPAPQATLAAVAPIPVAAVPQPTIAEPAATPPAKAVKVETPAPAPASTTPVPQRIPRRAPSRARKSESVAQSKPVEATLVSEPADSGKIDRHVSTSARDSAENKFRTAVSLVNLGRIAEAMEGFRSALEIDPRHEAARQTLVALLLEAKRIDEAAVLLEKGLALNTGNSGFAVLLARISVERGDIPGALALLQKYPAPAGRSPDHHAFAAALYQRLDRHKEALEQYQSALALAPEAGVWWVGLGISLQSLQRPKDALEAFTRARSTGNLSPDLSSFVEQRLKQRQ